MISLQYIRENADLVKDGARRKGETAPVDEILEKDARARALRQEVEAMRAQQKRVSSSLRGAPTDEQRAEMTELKEKIRAGEDDLNTLEASVADLLLYVPNPPHESVPEGKSEADNVTFSTWGEPKKFDFTPLPHYELGERLGLFDFERAAKLSGSRFAVLRGEGARLQRALTAWFLDVATREHGYTEIAPPYLVRPECMVGTANLPKFGEDAFQTTTGLYLIPTAEVPVTNLYRDEILDGAELPIAHVAYTPCWRSEAGAAGKDTRGYIRLHQFDKVEMVRFVTPESSLDQLELLTSHAESLLQRLGIHYRKLLMCSADLGFAQWKKYDLEAWVPGMNRWLEVSSCSVFADFQARRANIRFRASPGEKPQFLHTINGSGLAVPRTLDAVMETYQQSDGSIVVPDVLRPYMAGTTVIQPAL
jgi:seryl-tRNA synthetase